MLGFCSSPCFLGLCPSVFGSIFKLDYMAEHWPLASPFSCPATSFQGRPAEPRTCGAQFLVIQSKAGAGRAKDQRTGTTSLVMCPHVPTGIVFREYWASLSVMPTVKWRDGG